MMTPEQNKAVYESEMCHHFGDITTEELKFITDERFSPEQMGALRFAAAEGVGIDALKIIGNENFSERQMRMLTEAVLEGYTLDELAVLSFMEFEPAPVVTRFEDRKLPSFRHESLSDLKYAEERLRPIDHSKDAEVEINDDVLTR